MSTTGFRLWYYSPFYELCLFSVIYNHQWTNINKATCSIHNNPPAKNCDCGFYALKTTYTKNSEYLSQIIIQEKVWKHFGIDPIFFLETTLLNPKDGLTFMGYVRLDGRICENKFYYRGEYAKVDTIFLPIEFAGHEKIAKQLKRNYECDIVTFSLLEMVEKSKSYLESFSCSRLYTYSK